MLRSPVRAQVAGVGRQVERKRGMADLEPLGKSGDHLPVKPISGHLELDIQALLRGGFKDAQFEHVRRAWLHGKRLSKSVSGDQLVRNQRHLALQFGKLFFSRRESFEFLAEAEANQLAT